MSQTSCLQDLISLDVLPRLYLVSLFGNMIDVSDNNYLLQ